MYWLFDNTTQEKVRNEIENLVLQLAKVDDRAIQDDQLFPFVGRKDKRKAIEIIKALTETGGTVCDPFSGSGMLVYGAAQEGRKILANEFEIYTNRMANAPWGLPADIEELKSIYNQFYLSIKDKMDELYTTRCTCGNLHVLDSLFFDRDPLKFQNITPHERLGEGGKNVIYRREHKCPVCGAQEKHFDQSDLDHLNDLEGRPVSAHFSAKLIENSRINLSREFTDYCKLFPKRSMLALDIMWAGLSDLSVNIKIRRFLVDVFLSIIPQAKYKDYRSKSQDLHCPKVQLREVNLLYRFQTQFQKRLKGLYRYGFGQVSKNESPIKCQDFREFLSSVPPESVDLFLTDPPWADGNAYFEKAQIYHPWLDYSLLADSNRLELEVVITDAPSRKSVHNEGRWWKDIEELFALTGSALKTYRYFALMFRPIKAAQWLTILNRLKFLARAAGFEPLLTVDIDSKDPSMRVQQSACYAFVDDLVMVFIKLPGKLRRWIYSGQDIDQIIFQTAESLQDTKLSSFSYKEWRSAVDTAFSNSNLHELSLPKYEARLFEVFKMYCDEVEPQKFLTKHLTPFSGQLFDLPATERLFTYVPRVVEDLTANKKQFSYSEFVLKLSQYLENGTRSLINEVKELDMSQLLDTYAEQIPDTKFFQVRSLPKLPADIKRVMDLDPYGFEAFVGHLLTNQGFTNVVLAGRSGDRGVDLVAKDPEEKMTIVQCKQWGQNKVGSTPIQRLDSFARTRNAERKILITTSDFTPQGIDEARITGTETVNGKELGELIVQYMPSFLAPLS